MVCTLEKYEHEAYEKELGIPRILARLEDGIFEKLPQENAMAWPEKFLDCIPVGVDLSLVWPKFAVWLLADSESGIIKYAKNEKTKASILRVSDLYQSQIDGHIVSVEDWRRSRASASASAASYAAARAKAIIAQSEKFMQLL